MRSGTGGEQPCAGTPRAHQVVHLGAVVAAVLLMFHPAANAYIRATTPAPAQRGTRKKRP